MRKRKNEDENKGAVSGQHQALMVQRNNGNNLKEWNMKRSVIHGNKPITVYASADA